MADQNPLNPNTVLSILAKVIGLPSSNEQAELSSSSCEETILKSNADTTVALLHAALLSLGFRFLGIGESGNAEISDDENVKTALPTSWNLTGDTYSFRYRHTQSSFTFLVKAVKISKKLLVTAMAVEDGKIHQLELDLSDFTSTEFSYPATRSTITAQALETAFTSTDLLSEVLHLFKLRIVQKLIPGLHKPGYEESASTLQTQTEPERSIPRRPIPPYSDPLRDYSRPSGSGRFPLYGNPYSIGDSDLDPFSASPGLIPPGRMGPFPGSGGGMVVGPNHPMFQGGGYGGGFGTGAFPNSGQGYLPPGSVPQGARFDPIGPFGPRPGNLRPSRGPGGFGTGGLGPFSGDPDNDDLPPPGTGDMFL